MRSAETVYEMDGRRMLAEASAVDPDDVDHTAVVAFIRGVQQESYERGRKDGIAHAEASAKKATDTLFGDLEASGDYG